MISKSVILVLIDKRKEAAVNVQKTLTDWGCLIKTRLGLHDGVLDNCTNSGLLFLEVVGDDEKQQELCRKLDIISGVKAELVKLSLDAE